MCFSLQKLLLTAFKRHKHIIHQLTYTKHDTYIYNPHEQINLNYSPTNLNSTNLVHCNLLCLCIMKIDDCCGILLDKEEFSEYAATDESGRFIMSQFSFHSLYFYFFFLSLPSPSFYFRILQKSSLHYPFFNTTRALGSRH